FCARRALCTQANEGGGCLWTWGRAVPPPGGGAGSEPTLLPAAATHRPRVLRYLAGSTERLTLTGCRSRLDRVQHPMARDRVVERGAEMRAIAIVPSETRVRLGDVCGGTRALRRRPPILLWHG